MSKRRRTSSVASRGIDDDDDSQHNSEPSRKKKKVDPLDVIQQLYETIRNHKKDDGSLLCDFFIRAPKRRQEPAYYEVVANPIDLLKVQQKLKTDEYEDIDEFIGDIELLVSNTKAFYKRTSQEYKDACELWELVQSTKSKLLEDPKCFEEDSKGKTPIKERKTRKESKKNDDAESTSDCSVIEEESSQCEDLFTVVMTAAAEDGRLLNTVFQLLPSKKRYPKYYEVIDNPIDLRMIARKIQQNKYSSLIEMEKDLIQMTKNATIFNEPGSQIYKDAKALRKLVQAKRVEIDKGLYQSPNKASDRIRHKRLRSNNTLSGMIANLKLEEEEGDEDEDVVDVDDPDNPCWQLYSTVKTAHGLQGQLLCEAFLKLPSKRYYPDYFKEIRNPISLAQISKKLQKGQYGTVSEVAGDMNIMFENAKKYNRPDSKLYKDAVKLQKIMQKRVQELLDFDHQYSASEDDSVDEPPQKKPKSTSNSNSGNSTPVHSTNKLLTKGKYLDNIPLKKRLYSLCKCLMQYICEDGRQPMLMFMEKPSSKLYPEYYDVIEHPIDMLTIESNIKAEKYQSEEEILADFKLMFRNCRKFNEESSLIYEDAVKLEKILMDKVKELGPLVDTRTEKEKRTPKIVTPQPKQTRISKQPPPPPPPPVPTPPVKMDSVMVQKMRTLYVAIRDYKDQKGRQLSQIFQKLPSKTEYPDYYEVIKKPINIEQISQKLKSGQYEGLDDLSSDFILMFDNACKYNEPDSQIYKDALTLQKVVMQTKLQLRQDEQSVPDVQAAVQELLISLFISVYNHQDEEGRCFSDSMQELPEHDEVDGKKVRALSLDLIKRRLDSGQYKRLDQFQEDIFSCLQRGRALTRTDSQVFEDSIELQSFFIRQRDELCRNGDLLHSPALNYTLLDLSNNVNAERQSKQSQEPDDDDLKPIIIKEEPGTLAGTADNALSYNQQVYRIGDFVYAEGKERGMDPIILNIQRLWTNQEGQQMLYGNQYYRPNETYHVTTRKFLEKEVFKTDQNVAIPLNQVLGRCCVLSVKDYFRSKPEGVNEKDIYVCESRYSSRQRAFKKIKNWPPSLMTGYKLIPRDEPIEPKRVVSVFRQRVEKHKEEIAELEEQEKIEEKQKPNVPIGPSNEDGLIYYEQFNAPTCTIKTGDFVYMKTDMRTSIAQADAIWTNSNGEAYFKGPWVVMPSEAPHIPNRLFYKHEVFVSTLEDTHPVNCIVGKCVVLEHGEYISCRPTEIPENDVYICESLFDESNRCVTDLPRDGLKKYSHTAAVTQDEIYFFRRLINPPKIMPADINHSMSNSNPMNNPFDSVDSDVLMEDSMDAAPSVTSEDNSQSAFTNPLGIKKGKGAGKKLVTGYVLYSGDVRKAIAASNPDCNFSDVSRIVGNEWRKLGANEKAAWEERAARINEETERMMKNNNEEPTSPAAPPQYETVFECQWENCDWQFEDLADAIDHAVGDTHGHLFQYFATLQAQIPSPQDIEYQCQWRGCTRTRKTIPPFPNIQRLIRHVREVHMLKNTGRTINVEQRSKNYVPSRKAAMQKALAATPLPGVTLHAASAVAGVPNHNRSTPSPLSQNGGSITGSNGRIPEPLFVTVPPRTQRLLHSEAYIKYIEGLTPDNRNISNWEKQLKASEISIEPPTDPNRLPIHWLNNRNGNHGNILNALWTLRDFMFRDALGISKHL